MIARFIPVGLLLIFLLWGCTSLNKDIAPEVPGDVVQEVTLEEQVMTILQNYGEDRNLLLLKLEEILLNREHNFHWMLAGLAIESGDLSRGEKYILMDINYSSNKELLELYINILIAQNRDFSRELDSLKKIDQWNPLIVLIESRELINLKKYDAAEKKLKEFLDKNPLNEKLLMSMGDLYLNRVDSLGLEKKKVLTSDEDRIISGLYKKALEFYLLVPNPQGSVYYSNLASIYKKLGDNVNSLKSLTSAIEINPGDPWNYYDKGKILFYSGNNKGALENLLYAYNIDPNHFFTNVFLGRVYFTMGDYNSSLKHYSMVLEDNPDYFPAWEDYSVISYIMGYKNISLAYQRDIYNNKISRDPLYPLFFIESLIELGEVNLARSIGTELAKKERDLLLRDIYIMYADPYNTDDRAVNAVINLQDKELGNRLSYYVALCLYREGITGLSKTLLENVSFFYKGYEAELAKIKLGELYE